MKTLIINASQGIVRIESPRGVETSSSIERCVSLQLPQAPPAMVHAFSEIAESLLGPLDHPTVVTGVAD